MLRERKHSTDFFVQAFDDILDVAPPRGHGALWNPICLDPVHLTAGGEHHQTVMTVALAHESNTVVIGNFHGLLSAGSTVLPPKGVHRHSLDVATPSHRNQDVLAGDHVFSCDLAVANANLCQAVMSISLSIPLPWRLHPNAPNEWNRAPCLSASAAASRALPVPERRRSTEVQ